MTRYTAYIALAAVTLPAALVITGVHATSSAGSPTPAVVQAALDVYEPDLTPSSEIAGTPLATGTVVDAAGHAAENVPVTAEMWPSQEALGAMKVGDTVSTIPIAVGVTDPRGAFTLRVDPDATKGILKDGNQTINLDLKVPTDAGFAGDSVPADVTVSSGVIKPQKATSAITGARTLHLAKPMTVFKANEKMSGSYQKNLCEYQLVSRNNGVKVVVGKTYSTTSKVNTTFTYTRGSTSTLGMATSLAGRALTADGTRSVSYTATGQYDVAKGATSRLYKKNQDYGLYVHQFCNGMIPAGDRKYQPIGNPYGSSVVNTTPPTATKCAVYSGMKTFTIDKTRATTWSGGVEASRFIGISLSAKSGYSSATKITYQRVSGTSFTLCGTKDKPERNDAGQIVVKS